MKLYANLGSGSACVEAALAELSLPFERILVNYSADGIVDDSYVNVNPRRQIPALILADGRCLTESMAILMYLADTQPNSELAPRRGTFERAKLDQWMSFMLANIYEGELRKNYPHRFATENPDDVEANAEQFVLMNYQILENACGDSPFFFGHALTILDIYIWMFVNWSEDLDGLQELCPKVVKIAENVMKRPKVTPIHVTNFGQGLGWSAV